jgi:hypothetical protein
MAVDENGNEIADVVDNNSQSPTFVFNNKVFHSTEEVQAEARAMESSIKSGFDRKLAEERAVLQSEKAALAEDVQWYASHDSSLWNQYEEKVNGGRGFVGTVTPVSNKTTVPEGSAAFNDNGALKRVEDELNAIKQKLNTDAQYNDERAKVAVINTLKAGVGKYPYADEQAVKSELQIFYQNNNNRHATPDEVMQIVAASHNRTLNLVNKAANKGNTQGDDKRTVTPIVKGGTPPDTVGNGKRPSLLRDPAGFTRHIAEKLSASVDFN